MNIIRKLESLVYFAVFDAKILIVDDPSKRQWGNLYLTISKVHGLLLHQIIIFWNCQKILKHVMPKNLKETTVAPGQLWHKLYYFYFGRIFPKEKQYWMSKILKIQSRQVVRWEPMNQSNKVVKPLISLNQMHSMISEREKKKKKKKKTFIEFILISRNVSKSETQLLNQNLQIILIICTTRMHRNFQFRKGLRTLLVLLITRWLFL